MSTIWIVPCGCILNEDVNGEEVTVNNINNLCPLHFGIDKDQIHSACVTYCVENRKEEQIDDPL